MRGLSLLIGALLLIGGAALAAVGSHHDPSPFQRWGAPLAGGSVTLRDLTLGADTLRATIDGNGRVALRRRGAQAGALADRLDGLGPPPAHGADVEALAGALRALAADSASAADCIDTCTDDLRAVGDDQVGLAGATARLRRDGLAV